MTRLARIHRDSTAASEPSTVEMKVIGRNLRGAGVVAEVRYDEKAGVKTLRIRSTVGVRNLLSIPLIVQFEWFQNGPSDQEAAQAVLQQEANRADAQLDMAEAMHPGHAHEGPAAQPRPADRMNSNPSARAASDQS